VVSGLGKGVTASSIGVLLKACGYRVSCIKIGACAPRRPAQPVSC
jgi:CTP synthase